MQNTNTENLRTPLRTNLPKYLRKHPPVVSCVTKSARRALPIATGVCKGVRKGVRKGIRKRVLQGVRKGVN